ncbi:HGGxSTG domain-containing protein [Paenibacillus sp. FSL P4-0338]|uniref:HGGxSTG domain-containing protein n=1 Tax=Paenibacillus sp. FSL P4-0338 TaxID=2921635 RepID=UPI0030F73C3E
MDSPLCGAKTRSGATCLKKPMKNGRCYMHGGASTGPKDKGKHRQSMKQNKNSVKTGEYERIWFESLAPEEVGQYEATPTEALQQLDHEIRIADIRERRMMERVTGARKSKDKHLDEKLLRLEDGLSRVQTVKSRLIDQKMRLQEITDIENDNGSLGQLVAIVAQARKRYDVQK